MKLPGSEAHIWYFNSNDFDELDRYLQLLSQDELERVNRFKFEKDRKTYVLARGLLRILSERYLNIHADQVFFTYNQFGKPSYDLQTLVRFNVSHSGELIVLSFVAKGEVGVDVERIKTNFDIAKIAEGFFSKDEVSSLLAFPEEKRAKAFFNCWTRKEAFIKAKGVGLSFDLTSFSVSINDNSPELLRTQWNPNEKNDWKLFSFVPQEGYCSALSISSTIQKVSHFGLADLD
ncbi:4'-phosphopantetheinyl transferase family protein [Zobellia barbeyronii]|uniref:4'-phosphopantetheinyl transferase superfamily protein n=1 Tax=Zobellia barbeyronii TaxID=2748009 RepID=A0ABS5WID9_9FLAO|nr:4'-phosphopantetheinyl transferase superfamily protein [Zobellia barbeyronii]MBT2163176.1 4'-phosphopantetheinyl transferase superfamily protein [Zobellia barbeyronii]